MEQLWFKIWKKKWIQKRLLGRFRKEFWGTDGKPQINFAMYLEIELMLSNCASVIEIILCAGILIFCTFKDKVLYQSYLKNN